MSTMADGVVAWALLEAAVEVNLPRIPYNPQSTMVSDSQMRNNLYHVIQLMKQVGAPPPRATSRAIVDDASKSSYGGYNDSAPRPGAVVELLWAIVRVKYFRKFR